MPRSTASQVVPCCAPVLQAPIGKQEAQELAGLLKALSDPVRLQMLSFLAAQPDGEACVCHVVDSMDVSQPTVSHHLKLLHDAGLVAREKRGAWVYYRTVPERLEAIRAALATRRTRTARRA